MRLVCASLHHIKVSYRDFLEARYLAAEFYRLSKRLRERVLVQTGTRVEVYAVVENEGDVSKLLTLFPRGVRQHFRVYYGRDAAVHLFRLTCKIESKVLGETYIPAQVDAAFALAEENSTVGDYMQLLFKSATNVYKRARSETKVEGTMAVTRIAVKHILKEMPDLKGKHVVLFGAGLTGKKTAAALTRHGSRLTVVNRNYDIAVMTAKEIGAHAARYTQFGKMLSKADVLICATLASHYRVTAKLIKSIKRKSPLIIADVSPFGNVDPAVASIPGVTLIDGELRKAVGKNLKMEKAEVPKVEKIIEEEVKRFNNSVRKRAKFSQARRNS